MGEENKDMKKLKYEMPRLVQLNVDTGEGVCGAGVRGGICTDGSGEVGSCLNGTAAGTFCTDGSGGG